MVRWWKKKTIVGGERRRKIKRRKKKKKDKNGLDYSAEHLENEPQENLAYTCILSLLSCKCICVYKEGKIHCKKDGKKN